MNALAASPSRSDIRQSGINPNHWYVVAQSSDVTDQPVGVTLWQQAIALYRNSRGQIQALEDRCPHRFVKLSRGQVVRDDLECAYHGWRFNAQGQCATVPYLAANQKLPTCQVRCYPVREQDGFIWVFPGDPSLAQQTPLLNLPEWNHLNYIASVALIDTQAHFSYVIENLMDMYHGHLHQSYQAWASAELVDIDATGDRVDAHYNAQSYYRINRMWSIVQLFVPAFRRLHPTSLDVSYHYPHWSARLGNDFRLYCLFCPVDQTHTRAYLVHFTSLAAFPELRYAPIAVRRWMKNRLFNSAQWLLKGLIQQDVMMMEEEQQAYLENPTRRPFELNRTLVSVQRLIQSQAEQGQR
jgi:hypothetical protein